MLDLSTIQAISAARLVDAQVLLDASRWDGAIYLCGYSVEMALKARICQTLGWSGYPETNKEFEKLKSLKTHDFDVLLQLTGRESYIRRTLLVEWSAVATWDPESRYKPIGTASPSDAKLMVDSASVLVKKI